MSFLRNLLSLKLTIHLVSLEIVTETCRQGSPVQTDPFIQKIFISSKALVRTRADAPVAKMSRARQKNRSSETEPKENV